MVRTSSLPPQYQFFRCAISTYREPILSQARGAEIRYNFEFAPASQRLQQTPMNTIDILDTHWNGRAKSVAAALLSSQDHHCVIDPGPASTLDTLRQELQRHGLTVATLDAILLTHIHLDHAGGTGALVQENPLLKVYVHSRGATHMQDPSKLLASATRLWGSELPRLYGETLPVPAENLRVLDGGETLELGARRLDVAYTPGHASQD